nr:hypothetical protein [Candidatus Sigynarchaeota archaeon]
MVPSCLLEPNDVPNMEWDNTGIILAEYGLRPKHASLKRDLRWLEQEPGL